MNKDNIPQMAPTATLRNDGSVLDIEGHPEVTEFHILLVKKDGTPASELYRVLALGNAKTTITNLPRKILWLPGYPEENTVYDIHVIPVYKIDAEEVIGFPARVEAKEKPFLHPSMIPENGTKKSDSIKDDPRVGKPTTSNAPEQEIRRLTKWIDGTLKAWSEKLKAKLHTYRDPRESMSEYEEALRNARNDLEPLLERYPQDERLIKLKDSLIALVTEIPSIQKEAEKKIEEMKKQRLEAEAEAAAQAEVKAKAEAAAKTRAEEDLKSARQEKAELQKEISRLRKETAELKPLVVQQGPQISAADIAQAIITAQQQLSTQHAPAEQPVHKKKSGRSAASVKGNIPSSENTVQSSSQVGKEGTTPPPHLPNERLTRFQNWISPRWNLIEIVAAILIVLVISYNYDSIRNVGRKLFASGKNTVEEVKKDLKSDFERIPLTTTTTTTNITNNLASSSGDKVEAVLPVQTPDSLEAHGGAKPVLNAKASKSGSQLASIQMGNDGKDAAIYQIGGNASMFPTTPDKVIIEQRERVWPKDFETTDKDIEVPVSPNLKPGEMEIHTFTFEFASDRNIKIPRGYSMATYIEEPESNFDTAPGNIPTKDRYALPEVKSIRVRNKSRKPIQVPVGIWRNDSPAGEFRVKFAAER
jgi:hypothetical protein